MISTHLSHLVNLARRYYHLFYMADTFTELANFYIRCFHLRTHYHSMTIPNLVTSLMRTTCFATGPYLLESKIRT